MPNAPDTIRERAEAFALASRDLVRLLEAGDLEAAGRCLAERGRALPAVPPGSGLDPESAALLAAGCASGTQALDLMRSRADGVRAELADVERGRSGINAYRPAGPDSAACDIIR